MNRKISGGSEEISNKGGLANKGDRPIQNAHNKRRENAFIWVNECYETLFAHIYNTREVCQASRNGFGGSGADRAVRPGAGRQRSL